MLYLWGAYRNCTAEAPATQAMAQRVAEMGERVVSLGLGKAGADCIGLTCAQRLRQTPGITTGRVLGAQIVEEASGQSRVRVWLADLATLQQEIFVDFPCRGCDLNAELSSHAALLVERSADPQVVGRTADICTNSRAASPATATKEAAVEPPRDPRIALSTYPLGGVRINVSGTATALRRALKDMGYIVVPIGGTVSPLDPRAALPQALRGLPFLDVAFSPGKSDKSLARVHIRLTHPGESIQTVVDCQDTPCEDARLPGRVLATAAQLLDATADRAPLIAVQPSQGACEPWIPPACGMLIAQTGGATTGVGGDAAPAQSSSVEGVSQGSLAGGQPVASGSATAPNLLPCRIPPLSSYRRWQAGWALIGIGAAVLVPSIALGVYAQPSTLRECSLGVRMDGCAVPSFDAGLYGAGFAIAGSSIAVGAGLTISAAVSHRQRESNARGTPCQGSSP